MLGQSQGAQLTRAQLGTLQSYAQARVFPLEAVTDEGLAFVAGQDSMIRGTNLTMGRMLGCEDRMVFGNWPWYVRGPRDLQDVLQGNARRVYGRFPQAAVMVGTDPETGKQVAFKRFLGSQGRDVRGGMTLPPIGLPVKIMHLANAEQVHRRFPTVVHSDTSSYLYINQLSAGSFHYGGRGIDKEEAADSLLDRILAGDASPWQAMQRTAAGAGTLLGIKQFTAFGSSESLDAYLVLPPRSSAVLTPALPAPSINGRPGMSDSDAGERRELLEQSFEAGQVPQVMGTEAFTGMGVRGDQYAEVGAASMFRVVHLGGHTSYSIEPTNAAAIVVGLSGTIYAGVSREDSVEIPQGTVAAVLPVPAYLQQPSVTLSGTGKALVMSNPVVR